MQKYQAGFSVMSSEVRAFEQWRERYSQNCLRIGIVFVLILVFVGALCLVDTDALTSIGRCIAIVLLGSMFAWFGIYQLREWKKSRTYTIQTCAYGTVVSKSYESKYQMRRNINRRNRFVTVAIGTTEEEATCDEETFRALSPGDHVFLFTVGNGRVYALCV